MLMLGHRQHPDTPLYVNATLASLRDYAPRAAATTTTTAVTATMMTMTATMRGTDSFFHIGGYSRGSRAHARTSLLGGQC
jgi:hypothetical protein